MTLLTRADAVIHAGDLGFYDRESVERISVDEVALRLLHSERPRLVIREVKKMTPQELRSLAADKRREHRHSHVRSVAFAQGSAITLS